MTIATAEALESSERSALRRLIVTLADSKRLMGIRYSDWVLGAPSLETSIAVSSMAQDEWGHARLLYSMLKELGEEPTPLEHEREASAYQSVDALDAAFQDWAAVVAAMVVVDGALTTALEAFADGAYQPARARVPKMVVEEEFHGDLARAWCRRLSSGSAQGRSRLAEAVHACLPRTLAWLTPDDDPARVAASVEFYSPAGGDLRARYLARLGPCLEDLEIDASTVEAERGGWDESRGRGPGQPAEEAVERARGDLNRMLLVE